MKAVVVHGAGDLRVEERPVPEPGPGEVLLALEWGGVCGSDVAYWRHGASGTAKLRAPLVLGHEFAGRVAKLGPGVEGVEPGAAVTVHPTMWDGAAAVPERIAGRVNLWPGVRAYGSAATFPHVDGGFSEFKTVAADQLRPLPPGVDTRHGTLAEPLAVAIHAVRRGASAAGGLAGLDVLVNGSGPIGALVVAVAKHLGARRVTASDLVPTSLAIAGAMGADELIDARRSPLPDDVPLVFEASGAAAAIGAALHATERGGVLVQVGNLSAQPAAAALGDLVTREITWLGSYRFVDEMRDALDLLAGGLHVDPVMTHVFPIDRAREAMATAADRSTGSAKVMLKLDAK
jgi:L-idonate 5-dehydrogenase